MMRLSYILNILALGGSLAGIWQISSMVSLYEEQKAIIARTLEEKKSLVVQKDELNKDHAVRYSRERAKNQKLENEKFEAKMVESTQSNTRDKTESLISELEEDVEAIQKEVENLKLQLLTEQKNFDKIVQQNSNELASLPNLERKKNDIISTTQIFRDEIQDFRGTLENYEGVTKILKSHFVKTTASLFKDKSSRNWLEPGEFIRLSYMEIDLTSGLLGLPVGMDDGIRTDKLFAIRSDGDDICKIKITHAELNRSVASIVPLLGKPAKLLSLSEYDLYHL
jgi:polyhydroxyalkanoate synthesis regulator phasin